MIARAFFGALLLLSACSVVPEKEQRADKVGTESAINNVSGVPNANQVSQETQPLASSKAVANFVQRREICDHFRGEEADEPERKAFIEQQLDASCAGTDAELADLKARYAGDAEVLETLKKYDPSVELEETSPADEEKGK